MIEPPRMFTGIVVKLTSLKVMRAQTRRKCNEPKRCIISSIVTTSLLT